MSKDLEIRTVPEPKKASRRPKTVIVKSRSGGGGKTKVLALDGDSASFSEDILYVFKANVKAARKRSRERQAATGADKPVG